MKKTFDDIVRENTPWIFHYIRGKTESRETAEDLTQEVWLRTFRAYDSYTEDGRLRRWLMRIAQNTVRSYYAEPVIVTCVSLDSGDDEADPLMAYLADENGADPEEKLIRQELIADVLDAIGNLPEKHRAVMTYRFIYDMSVGETAKLMQIPEGSVKSAAHYAIGKIKKELKIDETITRKGDQIMDCREVYKYLFVYALGKLSKEKRAEIRKHLDGCEECRGMANALEKLIPHLPKSDDNEKIHFSISFPEVSVIYTGLGVYLEKHEEWNEILRERKGVIPDNETWMQSGFGHGMELLGFFLNEGEECKFNTYPNEAYNQGMRVKATYLPGLYEYTWQYHTFLIYENKDNFGSTCNNFGSDIFTAIYQAVPANHGKLKMKRGNGFINCGAHTFAYTQRYVSGDETIRLEYTYE